MDHVHHSHDHDHSHGHGHHHHDHDHAHADENLEQLFTIGICGLFGMVAVLLGWRTVIDGQKGMLSYALAPQFHLWVLVGGVALLALTLVRALAVWRAAGAHHHHDHPDHVHGPDCDHGHDHHGHDHDHSHGGIYWRAVVLLFPLVMFSLGLPNQGYSNDWLEKGMGTSVALGADAVADVQAKDGAVVSDFAEMARAAYDPDLREALKGRRVTVTGQLRKLTDREFSLIVLKMNCCAADQIPLKARIISDASVAEIKDFQWVELSGILQFVPEPGKDEYMPLIKAQRREIKQIKGP